MFDLFTASFRDLEEAFLADLLEQRRNDPLANLLVLSPSGHLLTRLQSELSRRSAGFLNIHFLTFYALAERLMADAPYTESVVTEPALYQEIIRQILIGSAPEAVDLEIRKALRLTSKPLPRGLTGALSATLKDLRDAGMRADTALQAAQEGFLGVEAPEAAATLALYARQIGLFETHRLRSSADLLRRAAARAADHPWLKNQKAIFLYGFYDMTGVQLDLVLSLADHAHARVYFPYEAGNPAYAYAEKLLKDPAFIGKVQVNRPRPEAGNRGLTASSSSVPSPASLREGRGEGEQGKAKPEVYSCSGTRDEVWLASKTVLKLMDEGIPAGDIAIVARNLGSYAGPLKEILRANEIPMSSSRQESAGAHPLMKSILAVLSFDEAHPNAKTLRSDLEKSLYVTRGTWHENPRIRYHLSQSWSSHITWAADLLRGAIRLPKNPTTEESALLENVFAATEDLNVLNILNTEVTRRHFLDTLFEKLEAIERPGPDKGHAGVQVMEVQTARGLSFRAILILGMNEKVFPRLIREDPFLSDAARAALAQATGCRLGKKLDGYEEERFLFELMRQAARERLFLFTQRSNEEGKALIPSVYLKELEQKDPAAKPVRLSRGLAEKFENLTPMVWTPKELSFLINRARLDPSTTYKTLGWNTEAFRKLLATHVALEIFAPGTGSHDGSLEDLSLVKPSLEKPFSPTGLEDLSECPFQYYAGHVLGIPVAEDLAPEGEITPKALGRIFHKTLELFYTHCGEAGFPKGDEALKERLKAALEECMTAFEASLSTVYPLALKASKILIFKELYLFLKGDIEELLASGYVPRWFEQPLEGILPTGQLPYRFYGKPDRLDTKEEMGITKVRVVDYKSGKPKPWSGRIETHLIQGKFLQLPIYLALAGLFAEKTLGKKCESTDATLRPVRETDLEATEKTLTTAFWKSASASVFIENIKELIKIIEKANFYIEPDTGDWGYCRRCDFALICRKEHMPTRIRAERDPLRIRVLEKLSRVAPKSE